MKFLNFLIQGLTNHVELVFIVFSVVFIWFRINQKNKREVIEVLQSISGYQDDRVSDELGQRSELDSLARTVLEIMTGKQFAQSLRQQAKQAKKLVN